MSIHHARGIHGWRWWSKPQPPPVVWSIKQDDEQEEQEDEDEKKGGGLSDMFFSMFSPKPEPPPPKPDPPKPKPKPPKSNPLPNLTRNGPEGAVEYLFKKKLGEGGQGAVYLYEASSEINGIPFQVAVKVSSSEEMEQDVIGSEHVRDSRSHCNVIEVYGIVHFQDKKENKTMIIMQYIDTRLKNASVLSSLRTDLKIMQALWQQLKEAAYCINDVNFVYTDLKLENVMLDADGIPYIVDLGSLSRMYTEPAAHTYFFPNIDRVPPNTEFSPIYATEELAKFNLHVTGAELLSNDYVPMKMFSRPNYRALLKDKKLKENWVEIYSKMRLNFKEDLQTLIKKMGKKPRHPSVDHVDMRIEIHDYFKTLLQSMKEYDEKFDLKTNEDIGKRRLLFWELSQNDRSRPRDPTQSKKPRARKAHPIY